MKKPKWFVAGDIDGFFGLMIDNLIQILVLLQLTKFVCGFPDEFIISTVLPGAAFSILIGNLLYSLQAYKLAQSTGRDDVTALPYGINTVSLFTFIFFVMFPVYQKTGNYKIAWKVGLMASLLSGLIEFFGSFVADWIRRITPRAALLSALAGIAITFISMDFLLRTFSNPVIAFIPLAVILAQYFGKIRFPARVPAGLVAIILGTIMAWSSGIWSEKPMMNSQALSESTKHISFYFPLFYFKDVFEVITWENIKEYAAFIIPMGITNVIGSLQNVESAEAAGDKYDTRYSLLVNGVGTILGAFLGSPFPTTIYIGHPGWKGLGARIGYSIFNGTFITFMCLFGLMGFVSALVPIEAGMPILLWIGIIIGAQAFESTPITHAPAIIFGLFPAIAGWGTLLVQSALRYANNILTEILKLPNPANISITLGQVPKGALPIELHGLISLSQGFLLTSMVWAALTVATIERRFKVTANWCLVGALLSALGLIHSYELMGNEILGNYHFPASKEFLLAYAILSVFFYGLGFFYGKEKADFERA